MKKIRLLTYISPLFFLTTCSTTNTSRLSKDSFSPLEKGSATYFLTQQDVVPAFAKEVARFNHLEDNNWTWPYIKNKLISDALENGANIIKVDGFYLGGQNSGIHGAKVTGKYFYTANTDSLKYFIDSVRTQELLLCNCSLIRIYRDEAESLLKTLTSIQLFFDGNELTKLFNRGHIEFKIDTFGTHYFSAYSTGESPLVLNIQKGKLYYIRASQLMTTNTGTSGIRIESNGKEFSLMDFLEGKLHYENVAN